MNANTLSRSSSGPTALFFGLFFAVFIGTVITATLVTFILPESFASTARLKVEWRSANLASRTDAPPAQGHYDPRLVQTEIEVLQSELILKKVVEEQNLNAVWGRKYAGGESLKTPESLSILKSRLVLRPVQNASIVQIRVFSENPVEAASIANAIAKGYLEETEAPTSAIKATLIDPARPGPRPVQPNKPKNIILGVLVGGVLGLVAGSLGAWLMRFWQGKSRKQAPPT